MNTTKYEEQLTKTVTEGIIENRFCMTDKENIKIEPRLDNQGRIECYYITPTDEVNKGWWVIRIDGEQDIQTGERYTRASFCELRQARLLTDTQAHNKTNASFHEDIAELENARKAYQDAIRMLTQIRQDIYYQEKQSQRKD